jgi:hypothetical protein
MSWAFTTLGDDAPPSGRTPRFLSNDDLLVFVKRLENVDVVDEASEARLRRVCFVLDRDVSNAGRNLVFKLALSNEEQCLLLKQVLSLGARPDVPNSTGVVPFDAALSKGKIAEADALAMCRDVVYADPVLKQVSY